MAVCRGVGPLLPDRQSGVIAVIPTDQMVLVTRLELVWLLTAEGF